MAAKKLYANGYDRLPLKQIWLFTFSARESLSMVKSIDTELSDFRSSGTGQYCCNTSLLSSAVRRGAFFVPVTLQTFIDKPDD